MTKQRRKCAICGATVEPGGRYYPFCGERCQIIDLGNWSMEKYAAHSPLTEADEQLDSQSPSDKTANAPRDDDED